MKRWSKYKKSNSSFIWACAGRSRSLLPGKRCLLGRNAKLHILSCCGLYEDCEKDLRWREYYYGGMHLTSVGLETLTFHTWLLRKNEEAFEMSSKKYFQHTVPAGYFLSPQQLAEFRSALDGLKTCQAFWIMPHRSQVLTPVLLIGRAARDRRRVP